MGKYLEYFRISFLTILAYRARYWVGIVTYLIYIALNTAVWRAVAGSSGDLKGYTLGEMVTWIAVGWVSRSFMYNNLDREVEAKVVDGSLSLDLLKPVDFQGMQYARVLGEGVFRVTLFAGPTALVAFPLFGVAAPASWAHGFAFALSSVFGALLYLSVNFAVGALSIPLRSLEGVSYAKNNLMLFLTGLLLPFHLLPDGVARVLRWLPFAGISDTPLRIYLGKVAESELPMMLLTQGAWCAAMLVGSRLFWKWLLRGVVIQGG